MGHFIQLKSSPHREGTIDVHDRRAAQQPGADPGEQQIQVATEEVMNQQLIKGGGGRLNDKPIAGDAATVGETDLDGSGTLKLSAGRKRHVLIRAI